MATSFNIEKAVAKYVESIAAEGSLPSDDAKELASHLHDSVEVLAKQGLTEEEAFTIAIKRLGTQRQLVKEYGKVRPSLKVNRIWVYFIFGFAGLTGLWELGKALLTVIYGNALRSGGEVPLFSSLLVAATHLVLCAAIGLLIYHKRAVAAYLQRKLQRRPLLMLVNAAFLMGLAAWVNKVVAINSQFDNALSIALYEFQNSYVEFSFYMLLFMQFIGVVSLFFTIRNPENASLKHLFSRPSIPFLLLAGFATELLAACTRVLPPHNMALIAGLYFGVIYFLGAFAISYYNRTNAVKYLCWYAVFGMATEIIVGIQADLIRLASDYDTSTAYNAILTPYFVLGLMVGLIGGYKAGRFFNSRLSFS
ncbi:permease prefix domain 1-containing protein [Parapedobacter sp. 10938]|uniref:permease prefix domain 1-containing protein n=1 Tax=Parapedobacter flavus TaxID=3110225 RepID=UPI002DBCC8D1|nr:permease prefix domain 1-containing protein [Parapedobacter sp. 10938]MEC3881395.1 permease prefix domain 1-containing protein [Parapedobacter sp. 10938]